MTARIVVSVVFIGLLALLGQVNGCNASRPYGHVGVRLHAALNN